MTEDQAREKWCPFVRVSPQAAHSNRGDHPNASNCKCIASDCMAWRFNEPVWKSANGRMYSQPIDHDCKLMPQTGYCGLAGNP